MPGPRCRLFVILCEVRCRTFHRLIAETGAEFRCKYHVIFVGSGIALDEAQTERLFEPTLLDDSWEV